MGVHPSWGPQTVDVCEVRICAYGSLWRLQCMPSQVLLANEYYAIPLPTDVISVLRSKSLESDWSYATFIALFDHLLRHSRSSRGTHSTRCAISLPSPADNGHSGIHKGCSLTPTSILTRPIGMWRASSRCVDPRNGFGLPMPPHRCAEHTPANDSRKR